MQYFLTAVQVASGLTILIGLYKLFYTPMNKYSLELQKNSLVTEQLSDNLEKYGDRVYNLEKRTTQSEKDIIAITVRVDNLEKKGE